jgi:SAM-dependent methyltransferase
VVRVRQLPARLRRRLLGRSTPLVSSQEYWDERADDLIRTYADPMDQQARGWPSFEVEERLVPRLLQSSTVDSVLVVGAGSGRQYAVLGPMGVRVRGFDISPRLVEECRRRFPEVDTTIASVVGAHLSQQPADAVISTNVLQHVPPDEIGLAVESVKALAIKVLVVTETTSFAGESSYMWAHNYEALFADWEGVCRTVVDETERFRMELMAWRPARSGVVR